MQDERARIYVAYNRAWQTHVFHACSMRHRRPVVLGETAPSDEEVEQVALAYPFAAAETENVITLGQSYEIDVYDLRRGRRVRRDGGTYSASDLVLTRYGTAAWLATSRERSLGPRGVWKLAGERKELLDPGEVDAGSLALSSSHRRLYWTRAGAPFSAELGP